MMRVTNNMILKNSSTNINGTKVSVDNTNTQMTTQKKISRPSEDPVTAIRSLRFSTTLSRVNQYYEKNIPDAESWLDVTETALVNMRTEITKYRTLLDQGANGTLTQDDRNAILTQLKSLQDAIYAEGNAEYAGRTVFTGYRTDKNLTFQSDETSTKYSIHQTLMAANTVEECRYYNGITEAPTTGDAISHPENAKDIEKTTYNRIRLAYDSLDSTAVTLSYHIPGEDATTNHAIPGNLPDNTTAATFAEYETEADWAAAAGGKTVAENGIVLIRETGELILGSKVSEQLKSANAAVNIEYEKTGFKKGELRPEYYYNCVDKTDINAANHITYTKTEKDAAGNILYDDAGRPLEKNYDIEYIIANNQPLAINLEACDIFNQDIYQDMTDAIDAVTNSINAHSKLEKIDTMLRMEQYADEQSQKDLNKWREAIQKEADYFDDNLQKMYSRFIGKTDDYLEKMSLAITKVGCKADQLELTEERMNNQQETVMELQSKNDDMDLSSIILKYTASYTAYQASLTAAGKLGEISLLNYI